MTCSDHAHLICSSKFSISDRPTSMGHHRFARNVGISFHAVLGFVALWTVGIRRLDGLLKELESKVLSRRIKIKWRHRVCADEAVTITRNLHVTRRHMGLERRRLHYDRPSEEVILPNKSCTREGSGKKTASWILL